MVLFKNINLGVHKAVLRELGTLRSDFKCLEAALLPEVLKL